MGGTSAEGRFVRPYAITGGRTGDGASIDLEAQIEATPEGAGSLSRYRWEASQVIDITRAPMALVEIAAKLGLPIGVARVVVADLEREGAVFVHREAADDDADVSYTDLLERVLEGIRSL